MKLMDVVVLGVLLAGGYYFLTNPEAMKQITDLFGNLAPPAGALGGDDPCAAECAAQTQASACYRDGPRVLPIRLCFQETK